MAESIYLGQPISTSGRDGGRRQTSEHLHQLFVALLLGESDDACDVVPGLGKMGMGIRLMHTLFHCVEGVPEARKGFRF